MLILCDECCNKFTRKQLLKITIVECICCNDQVCVHIYDRVNNICKRCSLLYIECSYEK